MLNFYSHFADCQQEEKGRSKKIWKRRKNRKIGKNRKSGKIGKGATRALGSAPFSDSGKNKKSGKIGKGRDSGVGERAILNFY